MIELIKKCCLEHRDDLFFTSHSGSLTFGQLWDRASRVAASLAGGSLPVVVRGHKEPYMPVVFLACLMVGRAYVPCDTFIPQRRLDFILEATKTDTVIDCEPDWTGPALSVFPAKDTDIAYMIFTSGSTGTPKGVCITQANLKCFVGWLDTLAPMNSYKNVRVLNQASYSFDLSVCDLYYSMCFGHTCGCLETTGADGFADITTETARFDPHVAVMTPSFAKLAMCDMDFRAANIPSLQCIFFCGEPLEKKTCQKLMKRFPGITLLNAYGPTECTCAVSAVAITEKELELPYLPVGRIGETSVEVFIEDGELVLRGDALSPGYLAGKIGGFVEDRYYTGDLGEITEDGLIFCRGRKDSQIKLNGYRIELSEIQNRLASFEGVETCKVVAEKDSEGHVKYIRAIAAGKDLDSENLREQLAKYVPEYMIPKVIETVAEIKLTANGKNAL
ncbi:MAG: AMP-binding protein [Clostridia bacterium]|nr:AMP-binding protein [Clostridia bacterium]